MVGTLGFAFRMGRISQGDIDSERRTKHGGTTTKTTRIGATKKSEMRCKTGTRSE